MPIVSLSCNGAVIRVAFGIEGPKMVAPIYEDQYDEDFKLLNRKVFEDIVVYFTLLKEAASGMIFEDMRGNKYGQPLVKDWYQKYLPLTIYSPGGDMTGTIDGTWLTQHTKYQVVDYFSKGVKLSFYLREMKGKRFIIVNWHVTPAGTIYCLLANNDQVKVIEIIDFNKTSRP